jgi:hypothetical protein
MHKTAVVAVLTLATLGDATQKKIIPTWVVSSKEAKARTVPGIVAHIFAQKITNVNTT